MTDQMIDSQFCECGGKYQRVARQHDGGGAVDFCQCDRCRNVVYHRVEPRNRAGAKSKFPSDDRPSDTKSVVLHRENDKRLLGHVAQIKGESRFWRAAGYFYLDFSEWLATQPDAPEPNRPFVYYRAWLEQRLAPDPQPPAPFDPESIAAAVLPGMRAVVEAALSTALAGLSVGGAGAPAAEVFEDLVFSDDLVLE